MSRPQTLALRLEMLRLRGALERAEVAAAATALRSRIAPWARVVTASTGAAGWMGALGRRPRWAVSLAVIAWRVVSRHPRAALVVAVAAAGLALLGQRARSPPAPAQRDAADAESPLRAVD